MHAVFERLLSRPDLLAMLSDSLQSGLASKGENASSGFTKEPVTLVSQTVEIIIAPKETSPSKEDGQTRKKWGIPVYDVDPEEEKVVNALRQKELTGKTITGTFFMKDQPPHVKHWIRWNEKKCDNVYIPRDLAFEVFGGQPISGAKVKCTITALGPDTATAWRKHPQCEAFEILSRGCRYLRSPPSPRTFSSRSTSSSNSSSSEEPDSWTYRRRNRTSQVPSARVPMCTRVSHKVIDLRGDGALNTRLPQSSVDG
jgi:hypothetical protein